MAGRIYIAGSLFTMAERSWNDWLAKELRQKGLEVCLPQEEVAKEFAAGPLDYGRIFEICLTRLEESAVVVALFEGPDVDSGTAFECGYAFRLGRPIIGVRTDLRSGGEERGLNLMLARACTAFVAVAAFEQREQLIQALLNALDSADAQAQQSQ